jgi:flavin reductase (DIM6/NTAB) family NADH-FMN oxidoreductase RutF
VGVAREGSYLRVQTCSKVSERFRLISDVLNTGARIPKDRVQREVSIDCFRQAMRELAGGVAIVTVGQGPDRTGFTATSVGSLSVEPPRLLVCLSETALSWKELQKWPYFGVNILRADHRVLADQFAGRGGLEGEDRYRGAKWTTLSTDGPAILDDALAGAECVIEEILLRHGHAIIIGQVRTILLHGDGQPLVYWQGAYRDINHT